MSTGALAERIGPDDPSEGVRAAVDPAFARLPSARGVVIMAAGFGDGPGASVTPWVLAGVAASARQHGLQTSGVDLRERDSASTTASWHRRSILAGLSPEPSGGRRIELELPGVRRPRRLVPGWIGQHLCIVVPMVHRRADGKRRDAAWQGPLCNAWAQLDRACSSTGRVGSARAGAKIAATAFASVTIVVDGSWWAWMGPDDTSPSELLALGRCVCLSRSTPSPSWTQRCTEKLEQWLSARLGLEAVRSEPMRVRGSGAAGWPQAPRVSELRRSLGGSLGGSLANQAVEALWRVGRKRPGGPSPKALAPRLPGPLARCWQEHQGSTKRPGRDPR